MIRQQEFGCAAAHGRACAGTLGFTPALRQRGTLSRRIECAWRTCA